MQLHDMLVAICSAMIRPASCKAYSGGGCELEGVSSFVVQPAQFSPPLLRTGQVESVQVRLAILSHTVCCDRRRLSEGFPLSWGECAGRPLHKDVALGNR